VSGNNSNYIHVFIIIILTDFSSLLQGCW